MNKEAAFIGIGFGMLILAAILIGFVFFVLSYTLPKTNLSASKQKVITISTYILLPTWFLIVGYLAYTGLFQQWEKLPPPFIIVFLVPTLVIIYVLAFAKSTKEIIKQIPPAWLIYGQTMRILVEIMLWGIFVAELFPKHLTLEGRNWDVLAGITAPIVAYFLYTNPKIKEIINPIWNITGLLLLVNIVVMAILSAPTEFRLFFEEPANTIVAKFPFVYLPAVIVPMAFLMHGLSLKQYLTNYCK